MAGMRALLLAVAGLSPLLASALHLPASSRVPSREVVDVSFESLYCLSLNNSTSALHNSTTALTLTRRSHPEGNSTWTMRAKSVDSGLPPRQLLFIHQEKSAGGFIETVMEGVLPPESLQTYHHCNVAPVTPPDDYFVMSSIRNPCDQYVSQWAYQCEKTYLWREHGQYDSAGNLNDGWKAKCPTFKAANETFHGKQRLKGVTVDKNVKGFQRWVNTTPPFIRQFHMYFEETLKKDRVNCWVRLEDLQGTFRQCLRKFENFTGRKVNWTNFDVMLGTAERLHNSTHDHCSQYYTPELRGHVEKRDSSLFSFFGYKDCCKPQ